MTERTRTFNERAPVSAPERKDKELIDAVRRALLGDMAVQDVTIRVSASDGTVTLAGNVPSSCEREEAGRAAASVPGVLAVRNEIAVWPPDLESELVRETTREAIEARRQASTSVNAPAPSRPRPPPRVG